MIMLFTCRFFESIFFSKPLHGRQTVFSTFQGGKKRLKAGSTKTFRVCFYSSTVCLSPKLSWMNRVYVCKYLSGPVPQ